MIRKMLLGSAMLLPAQALALDGASVKRMDARQVELNWRGVNAVDIFMSEDPDAIPDQAIQIVSNDRDGRETVSADANTRRYFLLRDRATGEIERVAERVLPLEGGSNFRDLGGYPAAGGKTVKWGRIFRSAAMARLTGSDYAQLSKIRIGAIIDLRSIEERELAPTSLDDRIGALFLANDYSMASLSSGARLNPDQSAATADHAYAGLVSILKPQLNAVFNRLLAQQGAVLFNCWGGQDRTGITSALILTALGVPRDEIIKDYHLTTAVRRPENEKPLITPVEAPNNPLMQYYIRAAKSPGGIKSLPLYAKDGESFIVKFFKDLEHKYGSVEAYLQQELDLTPEKIAALQAAYLE